ncbi:P-loop NTPase family protein [Carboxylicivirga linearis]|uniref:Bifunctional adenosylcobinamide kinase/adenosylcobinamide-phosphate guanylyltransferase n=1 Tax=Carboxylicivirga linearis TaxID=1628157 RepID=A0ABS5K0N2_9BACT|nr:bifunctional adenosylcobinamide kinase/adenosylcobinamide-phosphate guanylyltransferase [Carboxylicivirga linearis]MBS2100678.1 bifunctional adenosylcobinamide kinase/adenosylcobinamide-phosphate guanylyltransferase [Carboxylicivirga linearis]
MARPKAVYAKNLYELKDKIKRFAFSGVFEIVMGQPTTTGMWIIYGNEKNGKTWFALKIADYLSQLANVLYVSAEEGIDGEFIEACERAKIPFNNRSLKFYEYTEIEVLDEMLSKKRAPKIVFIDNVTIYADELKNGVLRQFTQKHADKLFVFLAHEERKEPHGATAKLIKKLSKVIVRVQGLACFVSGRCPGGVLTIDEEKAQLFHGVETTSN